MKKSAGIIILLTCICLCGSGLYAQSVPKIGAQAPLTDISGNASSILSKLGPALSLTDAQKPKVLDLVTGFLKQKASILPLAGSNQAAYTSKFGSIQNGLFRKLKAVLTAGQYASFLGLKPKTNDATNVLSQLFY